MVLQKKIVQLPFEGLQTKVDPKVAPIGSYEELDNVRMNRFSELVKRDGLNEIGASTAPSNINGIYSYINETGVITNEGLYAYSPSRDTFLNKGDISSPIVLSTTVIANTYTQSNCDSSVTSSELQGAVWEDSRGGVRCSVQDISSDTFLITDYSLSATGVKPKVVATDTDIVFFWVEPGTTTLTALQYDGTTNFFGGAISVNSVISATLCYDVIQCLGNVLISIITTAVSPNTVVAYYWDVSKASIATTGSGLALSKTLDITNITPTSVTLSLATDTSNTYVTISWQNANTEVWTKAFFTYLVVSSAELKVCNATTDPPYAITSCVDSSNNTYIFYSTYNVYHNSFYGLVSDNTGTPTVVSNDSFILQMSVASKAIFYSGNAYVILGYSSSSELQNTYFGVRNDGACFARMFSSVAGGAFSKSNCVSSLSIRPDKENTYICALLKVTKIISTGPTLYLTTSVFSEQIYFTPSNIDNKPLSTLLNIAGGFLKNYDGSQTVFEQGFHLYPETPTADISKPMGAAIPDGTYSWIVCWEWVDNQGNLYRSTTSTPVTKVLSDGPCTVTIYVTSLPITNKETRFNNTRTNVLCSLFRTKANGTTFYKVNQAASTWVYNDPTVTLVSVVDNYTDTQIGSNSLLYTTGGVFDNVVLPATNLLCISKNRVLVAGCDVLPNQVYYSKEIEPGVAIEFSAELSFLVDSYGGPITALASMDDKILIFKETLIYYISGVLPDKVGNGAAPYPLLISTNCGCNYPQSIVLTPMGIMFQSPKGIYLCDRTLQVSYIGQQIDAYTTNVTPPLKITSAVNLTDQNEVVFTDANNQGFIYDTFFQQWYTQSYTFSPIASGVLADSWYVASSSKMYQQIQGQSYDNLSTAIISTIRTNWLSFAYVDGFVRIYSILIYGSGATNPGTLKAKLYYDFQDYSVETVSIVPYNDATATTWGSDTNWGSGTPWGGSYDGTSNFMIRPGRQKCSAIKIEIYDEFPTGDTSSFFKFSGISMAVGIKPTWNKSLSAARRMK